MAYIDYNYYSNEYKGVTLDALSFDSLAERASDMIDYLTQDRIAEVGLEKFPPLIQSKIKKAVASQVEYIHQNGGVESLHSNDVSSVSIGNFSYSSSGESTSGKWVNNYSKMTINYLLSTGLMYNGVRCYG